MYTSIILCEMMNDHESLQYIGFKKYFKTSGYGHNVLITGLNSHKYEYDEYKRPTEIISAIDAINFPRMRELHQFSN